MHAIRRIIATAALISAATSAHSAVTITYGGSADIASGYTYSNALVSGTVSVNSFTGGLPATYTPPIGGVVVSGSLDGLDRAPFGNNGTDQYLSLPSPNPSEQFLTYGMTFTPGAAQTYFGMYWGSIDAYNEVRFYKGLNLVASMNGAQISASNYIDGSAAANNPSAYVNFFFTGGDTYDRVVLVSSQYAFESDNHAFGTAAPVPEPSEWAMMIAGLGIVGLIARKRRQHAAR